MHRFRISLDTLGMCASTLCMLHCLALPALLMALPVWSALMEPVATAEASADGGSERGATEAYCAAACCAETDAHTTATSQETTVAACCATPGGRWFHLVAFATVAPLGLTAWGFGIRRHRRAGVIALGMLGVLLVGGALLFGHELWEGRGELAMNLAGGLCMISAHLWNRRACSCCHGRDAASDPASDALAALTGLERA